MGIYYFLKRLYQTKSLYEACAAFCLAVQADVLIGGILYVIFF